MQRLTPLSPPLTRRCRRSLPYTPASSGWLESARKVDDLTGRLESLEAALRDMEAKAVQHLDKSLQVRLEEGAARRA